MTEGTMATPRLAAGALFVDQNRILLVRKTYGNRWDIPGGYVDRGESPASACTRELSEELALDRKVRRLLVHDWAPNGNEGDKILYVFDCGDLSEVDYRRIQVDGVEIESTAWVPVDELADLVIPRLHRRLSSAYDAHRRNMTHYLENGQQVP